MKSEPWIDKLYQQSLASREIPLDLNHWAQVESMIIAREKAERKRRIILWCVIVGLGLGLSAVSWNQYLNSKNNESKSISPTAPDLKTTIRQPDIAIHTEPLKSDINKPASTNTSDLTTDLNTVNHPEHSSVVMNKKSFNKSDDQAHIILNQGSIRDKNKSARSKIILQFNRMYYLT
jgi:hypothetical protein